MNLASWIILGVVVAILALAVKATFFGKKSHGSCCDAGDCADCASKPDAGSTPGCASSTKCASCNGCGAVTAIGALQPTYKDL